MISTNDKNLAIQMWQEVKNVIEEDSLVDVEDLKDEFCVEHNLRWKCNCILCEEYQDKGRCLMRCPLKKKATEMGVPLETCGCSNNFHTDYAVATSDSWPLEERLRAIDNIINAIQGVQAVD